VDILTYVSWKLARGALPPNRVIGTGTNLDSSRLRFLIADKFGVNAHNIHGYLVGEHGDSSVPLWSGVSVANVPILELPDPNSTADADGRKAKYTKASLRGFHDAVVGSAYEVIKLKGYTSWAIGYSVASLVKCILRDQRRIYPVSVLANGFYGIDRDVYLSLPSQLGRAGVLGVANLSLDDDELLQLRRSASTLWDMQSGLEL
jgi:L-lactate dehydrogenase